MTASLARVAASLAAALIALAGAGCGDTSKRCGPGTADLDDDGLCDVDPSACQGGTVLISGSCVDPTDGLAIDLTEGAEPNNAGIGGVEPSGAIAGEIHIKPQGQAFVAKGTIAPFRDADGNDELDPDMDTYELAVAAPTLLDVSVDGVGGLLGAFLIVPIGDHPAGAWRRFGIDVGGDASRRQIYLPAAGAYALSVGDTRSMFIDGDSPPAAGFGGAAGGPDAHYFLSITALPVPAPTPLTAEAGVATARGTLAAGEVRFFTAPMDAGLNHVALDIATSPQAALVLLRNGTFHAQDAERYDFLEGHLPASAETGGWRPGDAPLIVADTVYHYGPGPAAFELSVAQRGAGALSRTGGTASQPEEAGRFSVFSYEVAAADEVTGVALSFDQPVGGRIVDEHAVPVASFTYNPGTGSFSNRRFTSYTGLIRHRAPGRYYLQVFEPTGTGPAALTATSTIAPVAIPAIAKGALSAPQLVDPVFHASASAYDAGTTDRWQRFDAQGAGTGDITNRFYDPAHAYGRLGTLITTGTGVLIEDAVPIFATTHPETGAPHGRVLLDDPTTSYLVTTTAATGTGTFALDVRSRGHQDLGTLAAGQSASLDDQLFTAATPERFYLLRAATGDKVAITAAPAAPLDASVRLLSRDEAVQRAYDSAPAGGTELVEILQSGEGWTAFSVSAGARGAPVSADLRVSVSTFAAPVYQISASPTSYEDACGYGAQQLLHEDGSGIGPADDEGLTAPIPTPSGFHFFGLAEPQLTASSNGWLGFGPVLRAGYANLSLPSTTAPNAIVAPFWDDLTNVTLCTRTLGSRLVVQWTGTLYPDAPAVAFQAILDGATGTIELVWGPGHEADGATATVGIEDQLGEAASQVGFNTAGATPAGTSLALSPSAL